MLRFGGAKMTVSQRGSILTTILFRGTHFSIEALWAFGRWRRLNSMETSHRTRGNLTDSQSVKSVVMLRETCGASSQVSRSMSTRSDSTDIWNLLTAADWLSSRTWTLGRTHTALNSNLWTFGGGEVGDFIWTCESGAVFGLLKVRYEAVSAWETVARSKLLNRRRRREYSYWVRSVVTLRCAASSQVSRSMSARGVFIDNRYTSLQWAAVCQAATEMRSS